VTTNQWMSHAVMKLFRIVQTTLSCMCANLENYLVLALCNAMFWY